MNVEKLFKGFPILFRTQFCACCLVQNNGELTKFLITAQKNMNMASKIILNMKCDRFYIKLCFGIFFYFFIGILSFKAHIEGIVTTFDNLKSTEEFCTFSNVMFNSTYT